jgi:hypothetical protein
MRSHLSILESGPRALSWSKYFIIFKKNKKPKVLGGSLGINEEVD